MGQSKVLPPGTLKFSMVNWIISSKVLHAKAEKCIKRRSLYNEFWKIPTLAKNMSTILFSTYIFLTYLTLSFRFLAMKVLFHWSRDAHPVSAIIFRSLSKRLSWLTKTYQDKLFRCINTSLKIFNFRQGPSQLLDGHVPFEYMRAGLPHDAPEHDGRRGSHRGSTSSWSQVK